MEKLRNVFPGDYRSMRDLFHIPGESRVWVTPIRADAAQKPGFITTCGILGIMSGVQISGTTDRFSSCIDKMSSCHAYQLVVEGVPLDLVDVYGKSVAERVSNGTRNMTGCSFLYRGIVLCFACHRMEPASSMETSLKSRIKAQGQRLRSSIE